MKEEQKTPNPSRRDFMSRAAGGVVTASMVTGAAAASPLRSTVTQEAAGAHDRVNIGFIGSRMQIRRPGCHGK